MLAMPWARTCTKGLSSTLCSTGKMESKPGKLKRPGQDEAVCWDEANKIDNEDRKFSVSLAGTQNALRENYNEDRKFSVSLAGTPKCITRKLESKSLEAL